MLKPEWPYYLANEPHTPNTNLEVTDKFSGEVATRVALADPQAIDDGIAGCVRAAEPLARMAPYERQAVLNHCVQRFTERFDELALALCIEAGKPIRDSRGEVSRLIDTFRIAAEESVRMRGELMNLEISPRARGYRGMWKRVPIGPCSFISPFNFPLNLAAHKVAPAIAVGCPFVLKPASRTPIGALIIGEVLAETDLPPGTFSILPCSRDGADLFTTDDRLKLLSFTGSPAVGWDLKAKLVAATSRLVTGDPKEEATFIGPMISEREAARLENWIGSAVAAGGKLLCGGGREGAILEATLLENVPSGQDICAQEAFGPVAVLSPFRNFEEALAEVNNSVFGLQAGVFTRDLYKMQQAWDTLEVGGVIIGDVPSWRVDNMPYGGVKESGLGREGIAFAMEDMTEIRNLVIRTP
jgi:acyl-CoA reductase-like NAD-dependent aldehyde dehydrogenase